MASLNRYAGRNLFKVGFILERASEVPTLCILLVTAVGLLSQAGAKLLWHDELFTLHFARYGTLQELWNDLHTGVESQPLPFFIFTRWMLELPFGNEELRVRLPSVLAYLGMIAGMYKVVRLLADRLTAYMAMILPSLFFSFQYGSEARGYSILLCGTAWALYFYLRLIAPENPRRYRQALGLVIALWLALCGSFFAIFLCIPFAIAEVHQLLKQRRIDWVVVIAALLSALPFFALQSQRNSMSGFVNGFWARPKLGQMIETYSEFYQGGLPFLFFVWITLFLSYAFFKGRKSQKIQTPDSTALVLISALALLPVFIVLAAKLSLGGYTFRYAISGVLGGAILVALIFDRVTTDFPIGRAALVTTLMGMFGLKMFYPLFQPSLEMSIEQTRNFISSLHSGHDEQVAISDGVEYFKLMHYATPEQRRRLFFVTDPSQALRLDGVSTIDWCFERMPRKNYLRFVKAHELPETFAVYGSERWLTKYLLEKSYQLTLIKLFGVKPLHLAKPPSA